MHISTHGKICRSIPKRWPKLVAVKPSGCKVLPSLNSSQLVEMTEPGTEPQRIKGWDFLAGVPQIGISNFGGLSAPLQPSLCDVLLQAGLSLQGWGRLKSQTPNMRGGVRWLMSCAQEFWFYCV